MKAVLARRPPGSEPPHERVAGVGVARRVGRRPAEAARRRRGRRCRSRARPARTAPRGREHLEGADVATGPVGRPVRAHHVHPHRRPGERGDRRHPAGRGRHGRRAGAGQPGAGRDEVGEDAGHGHRVDGQAAPVVERHLERGAEAEVLAAAEPRHDRHRRRHGDAVHHHGDGHRAVEPGEPRAHERLEPVDGLRVQGEHPDRAGHRRAVGVGVRRGRRDEPEGAGEGGSGRGEGEAQRRVVDGTGRRRRPHGADASAS